MFDQITSKEQLKATYYNLAKSYHPDCGGSVSLMQRINEAYAMALNQIEEGKRSLQQLIAGDQVFVNGTECRVIVTTSKHFVARALGRDKQAWFDRSTGIGIHNPNYKATLRP